MKTNPFFFALALLFQLLWTTAAYADTAASTTKYQCAQQTGHYFCAIAMNRIKHGQGKYRGFGLALAGLIIGILIPFLVLSVAFLFFFVG